MQNRVVEAKEELETALSHRPRDAQSQDLLAGVYFRLGVYPTAIRLWRGLLADFPGDVTLHVNVGLAFFKTGQPDDARDHLDKALELDPDHERAWGYLGLTLWRLGQLDAAREAFLRGGQLSMAKRMEEALGEVEASIAPPPPDAVPPLPELELRDGVRLSVEVERPSPSGEWNAPPATIPPPAASPRRASRSIPALAPPKVEAVAEGWALELPEDTPLAVGAEGELLIQSTAPVFGRLQGLRAVRGSLETSDVQRCFRGRESDEALGGEEPIVRWAGPIAAVVRPPEGLRFHAVRVSGSQLYVREELVQGFDDGVVFESGRLPLAGEPVVLLSFSGDGVVVLRLPRTPAGIEVAADQEVRVDPDALVGWIGRLFPREVEDGPVSVPLALNGQGILLVT